MAGSSCEGDDRLIMGLAMLDLASAVIPRDWIDDCINALATAPHFMSYVFDVPVVILGARIDCDLPGALMTRLRTAMVAVAPDARYTPGLVQGAFGSDAGAAPLPMFFDFSPRIGILKGAGTTPQEVTRVQF
jgi:predicted NBD/HSP70 family sugar kinase